MNKTLLFLICLSAAYLYTCTCVVGQGTWTKKANFPSAITTCIAFAIGSKGYVGLGDDGGVSFSKKIYEYDPASNTWTRKNDFPGPGRTDAVACVVGNKAYVGIGDDDGNLPMLKDWWEYDPANDSWTQKADFAGGPRTTTAAFAIGNKAYLGMGDDDDTTKFSDFWEYDPQNNTWTQKADFSGGKRTDEIGFSIGNKGYCAVGSIGGTPNFNDLWEYDPVNDSWAQKADYGGAARHAAVGFTIDSIEYIGTGTDDNVFFKDFWAWNQNTNTWTKIPDFPGTARREAVAFSINGKGYVGTGCCNPIKNDFWEYDPNPDTSTNFTEEGLGNAGVTIYPNPFNSVASVHIMNAYEFANDELRFAIYDLTGREIQNIKLQTANFKLQLNLPAGFYVYQIKSRKEIIAKGKLLAE